MNYELAKELADAGFPQSGKGSRVGPSDKLMWRSTDRVYQPTLTELIQACGNRFDFLANKGRNWRARADNLMLEGEGSTPDEAVAKLWLTLNKKSA